MTIAWKNSNQNQRHEFERILWPLDVVYSGWYSNQFCASTCKSICIELHNILKINQQESMASFTLGCHFFGHGLMPSFSLIRFQSFMVVLRLLDRKICFWQTNEWRMSTFDMNPFSKLLKCMSFLQRENINQWNKNVCKIHHMFSY